MHECRVHSQITRQSHNKHGPIFINWLSSSEYGYLFINIRNIFLSSLIIKHLPHAVFWLTICFENNYTSSIIILLWQVVKSRIMTFRFYSFRFTVLLYTIYHSPLVQNYRLETAEITFIPQHIFGRFSKVVKQTLYKSNFFF